MPFCPVCRYEYEAGIYRCPDCDETLVSVLKDDAEDETEREIDWVPLASLTSQQYSQMLVDTLREKGIEAVELSGTGHFGKLGMMGPSSFIGIEGTYIVLVAREHLDRADDEGAGIFGDDWSRFRVEET